MFSVNKGTVVTNLLFPVKLGPLLLTMLALAGTGACGYRAAYGCDAPEARLAVVAAANRVARIGVGEAVLHGLRSQLSTAGALRSGAGWPRVVVEILRVDEATRGIAVQSSPAGDLPIGRGVAVAVVARAWVEVDRASPPQRDTGDVRRVVVVAAAKMGQAAEAYGGAAEAAAWEVGRALGRRVLGEPVPLDEPL